MSPGSRSYAEMSVCPLCPSGSRSYTEMSVCPLCPSGSRSYSEMSVCPLCPQGSRSYCEMFICPLGAVHTVRCLYVPWEPLVQWDDRMSPFHGKLDIWTSQCSEQPHPFHGKLDTRTSHCSEQPSTGNWTNGHLSVANGFQLYIYRDQASSCPHLMSIQTCTLLHGFFMETTTICTTIWQQKDMNNVKPWWPRTTDLELPCWRHLYFHGSWWQDNGIKTNVAWLRNWKHCLSWSFKSIHNIGHFEWSFMPSGRGRRAGKRWNMNGSLE